jgi:hypothetical protein
MNAQPEFDPIYIHYSQPSIQVDWLLESTVDGSTWIRRFSSFEAEHNRMAKIRNGWVKALQDLGYSPQFLSSDQIVRGELSKKTNAVLVFSQSWAMSSAESLEIQSFTQRRNSDGSMHQLFCDCPPGLFDEHGKLHERSDLQPFQLNSFHSDGAGISSTELASYSRFRLKAHNDSIWREGPSLRLRLMPPPVSISPSDCVRIHRFTVSRGKLVAFERNINYQMSEALKQAGGNEPLEKPIEVEATLRSPAHVYDLRSQKYLGQLDKLRFTLDPWKPSLFALSENKLPEGEILNLLSAEN